MPVADRWPRRCAQGKHQKIIRHVIAKISEGELDILEF